MLDNFDLAIQNSTNFEAMKRTYLNELQSERDDAELRKSLFGISTHTHNSTHNLEKRQAILGGLIGKSAFLKNGTKKLIS